jgi:ABC-type thiamine transport system ATPase subunit
VVAVARDIDLGTPDLRLPHSPAQPEMLAAIAEQWGLTSPVERLTSVLSA